ncbi:MULTISPECIES: IclR family transcriptional regulator [Neobacillus]|uniref:IclR family transcriptional regulator n=1 Tax=Neobacillus rhizophilus TaxID=2833579 RepID=A0A942U860_9BACI|nr:MULTISPECIES: IclR family transcriptional regulator [Neobacillus]MBS4214181.1 IclR family transcriptional regulator [Neobacillus rhizophilus]
MKGKLSGSKTKNIKNEKYVVPAIDNAVKILEYLMKESPKGKSVSEISNAVALNPSTSFRILHSLLKFNMVSYSEKDKAFKLGFYLTLLGQKASDLIDLQKVQVFLEKASLLTNQTCIFSQRYGDDKVIYLAKQESTKDFRINVNLGQIRPMTTTSTGKCFLAFLNEEEVDAIIDYTGGLKKVTEYTVDTITELKNQLRIIRSNGYAIASQETFLGVCGVAAPVFDGNNDIRYVLSTHCFYSQVSDEELHSYGRLLKDIAHQISTTIF